VGYLLAATGPLTVGALYDATGDWTIPICVLLAVRAPLADATALVVFAAAALSDALDGHIARSRHEVTALGAAADPLADKVLVVGTLAALAFRGLAPAWAVALIAAREVAAVGARTGRSLPASGDGKAKTSLQMLACAGLIAAAALTSDAILVGATIVLGLALALTVFSGVRLMVRATQTRADAG
jgi:CDP-diacylglycerol--glycerol-3-phosphate 3-phosphatidyltransferase